jgi:hypothetical protein
MIQLVSTMLKFIKTYNNILIFFKRSIMLVIISLHVNLVVLFEILGKAPPFPDKKTDLVILDYKFALGLDFINLDRFLFDIIIE